MQSRPEPFAVATVTERGGEPWVAVGSHARRKAAAFTCAPTAERPMKPHEEASQSERLMTVDDRRLTQRLTRLAAYAMLAFAVAVALGAAAELVDRLLV